MNVLVFWDFLRHFAGQALGSASMLQVTQRRWLALGVARQPTGYLALDLAGLATLLLVLSLTFLDLHLRGSRRERSQT